MNFNYRLGINAKIYRTSALFTGNEASDVTSATKNEMSNVRQVAINGQAGEADISTRATSGWRATAPTLREMEVTFQMVAKSPDTDLAAIRTAWLNSSEVGLVVLTGAYDEAGNEGPAGNFTITNFSRNEDLEEAIVYDVTAKVSSFPQWFVATT